MRRRSACARLAGLLLLAASSASALPDLDAPEQIGALRIFRDHERASVFYYAPGDLQLARDSDGAPALRFLAMRYVGTAAYGDQGESGGVGTLTMRFQLEPPSRVEFAAARLALGREHAIAGIELRPLPITDFRAALAYAPIGGSEESGEDSGGSAVTAGGHFEADGGDGAQSDADAFWSERTFTIPMDANTAQLFWALLQRGEVALSITYAFYTRGVASSMIPEIVVDANTRALERDFFDALDAAGIPRKEEKKGVAGHLLDQVMDTGIFGGERRERREHEAAELPIETRLVHASALGIRVDAKRWPELFQRVDFNEQAPPGYGALRVYCYDFKDDLRPELFFKKVEIAATAVGGRETTLDFKFLKSQPDLYARSVRFENAVLLDHPYRYRVSEAKRDGTVEVGPWVERASWSEILDVTSRPEEPPATEPEPEAAASEDALAP